jgi:hypothetical protein
MSLLVPLTVTADEQADFAKKLTNSFWRADKDTVVQMSCDSREEYNENLKTIEWSNIQSIPVSRRLNEYKKKNRSSELRVGLVKTTDKILVQTLVIVETNEHLDIYKGSLVNKFCFSGLYYISVGTWNNKSLFVPIK